MAESDIFVSNDVEMDVNFGEVFVIDQGVVYKIVASKYNNTTTYVVGAYVVHLEKLYRCITAIEEPEEFDSEKWTQVLLANEMQIANANIALKANADSVYDKTAIDSKITTINNALALKANSDDVYAKADTYNKTEVDNALDTKADADTTYSKTEVDDALALKADSNSVYSKTDTDTLLNTKADKSTTYTKTEVDTALANKANSDDVYTKTETYSKTEVDTDIYKKTETYSKTEVDNKIANLPTPMQFKGTLGTGGTVTDLPTASISNDGFTYKVITDGTYASIPAKVGDMFTSNGSEWVHIPSGDETFTDTWRGIKVNGAEKLGSSINTGSVDFKDGTNSTAVFDPSDSSIKFNVDGYTQAQVDAKLADKANVSDVYAKSETYSQAEVDSKLLAKADSSDVYTKQETYTKTEVNTALSEKADTSAVTTALALKADKADTYTKEEVDDKFDEIDLIGTASGAIASFETNYTAPLNSLKCEITAKQDLHGYDHPWAGGGGKNLFDNSNFPSGYGAIVATYNPDGTVKLNGTASGNEYFSIPIDLPNSNYVLSVGNTSSNANAHVSFVNHNSEFYGDNDLSTTNKVINISGDISAIVFYVLSGTTLTDFTIKPMLELGSTATSYEPYSNICPIVGHSELNLTRCGMNIWDEEVITGYWDIINGNHYNSPSELCSKNIIPVKPQTTYYFYRGVPTSKGDVLFYDVNKNYMFQKVNEGGNASFTTPADCYYIRFNVGSDYGAVYHNDVSINYPSTDTAYHAYNGQTFTVAFGQTVYGGVYDKSGRLTITHATADEDTFTYYDGQTSPGGLHWVSVTVDNVQNGHAVCSMLEVKNTDAGWVSTTPCLTMENGRLIIYTDRTSLADFKTYYDGLQIAYELATPIVVDVPSISVSAENGVNNIISDGGGDVDVEYYTGLAEDIKDFIGDGVEVGDLANVEITTPSNDQVLKYDSASQKWVNGNSSGGSAHNYSTTEQVVGTWVDGSPVYEKTVYSAGGVTGNFDIPHNVSNLDRVISYSGTVKDTDFSTYHDIWTIPRLDDCAVGIDRFTTTVIKIVSHTDFNNRLVDWYITFRYTKST